ncbi:MAG: hypothetical protein PVG07_08500 [Acidobacteriota bacterium]
MTHETEEIEHDRYREWLTLEDEPGAELRSDERRLLAEHVAECAACRRERELLVRMDRVLSEARVRVRQGFRDDVMLSLPAAGWESRSPRSWRLPVAVMLFFGVAAALLLGVHSAGTASGPPLAGAVAAVAEAVTTGLLAGTGMLWASWRGIGLALDTLLSPSATVALLVLVLSVDVLLLALIARRGRTSSAPAPEGAEPGVRGRAGRDG